MSDIQSQTDMSTIFYDIISSPVHLILISLCLILIYKIFKLQTTKPEIYIPEPKKPKIKKRNLTLDQLKEFDGIKDKTILIALNGNIYDVTRGISFYGPDGPYGVLAGRDASRSLATFSLDTIKTDLYDDISDLNPSEMDQLKEWEMQFKSKYDLIGKLIRPGEPIELIETDEDETSDVLAAVPNANPTDTKPKDD